MVGCSEWGCFRFYAVSNDNTVPRILRAARNGGDRPQVVEITYVLREGTTAEH